MVHQGNKKPLPRTNPKYLKSYYYIKTENRSNKGFRKDVYFPVGTGSNIIVHYLGDESLSVMMPHGNSNKKEPYFRTKPSVKEEIQKKIVVEKPHIVYKNLVCENVEGHDAVSKPRNVRQLHNAKATKQEGIRLTRDAIYNTHELAYEGGFIHFLSTYPDLCIVAGDVEMVQELNTVIQLRDEDLLLSYDTTFNLGEFYVSPLVFKHVIFEANPLVAGLFLIHERKLSETHEHFFKILSSLVKNMKGVPIVTDMESAIVKAIRENTTLKQIGCWRHLRQDVQRWLSDNLPKVERSKYVNELYDILRTTTERQCVDMMKKMEKQWDEGFTRYFKKSIEPKLGYFCAWSIANSCKLDPKNGITTNQSEGFNFLLKDFQSWKEVPLDSLLMSLKLIQGFYLEEEHRGKANLGTFRLKPKYARYVQFFFQKKQQNKTKQSVFLYHCSVFAKIVSMIRKYHNHKPQTTPWHCSVFPQRNKKTEQCVFVPLFRFLHHCSVFSTTEQKTEQCVFVPLFRFLHFCSVFSTTEHKTEQCVFVPLFRFLHHCSDFCKNSEYDQEISQSQTADNPMALFRVLHHCSVFPQRNKKTEQCVFVPLFRFLHHCSVFSTTEQKTEQCVFVPLFRFLHFCSVFPQQNKKGTVCFCTTVPFFVL